jgi:hypothetical protein
MRRMYFGYPVKLVLEYGLVFGNVHGAVALGGNDGFICLFVFLLLLLLFFGHLFVALLLGLLIFTLIGDAQVGAGWRGRCAGVRSGAGSQRWRRCGVRVGCGSL